MRTVLMRAPPSVEPAPDRSAPTQRPTQRERRVGADVDGLERAAGLARLDGRVGAGGAGRVAAQLQLRERGVERVEQEQPAGERVADAEQELQGLVGLEQAHDPGHDAEDAGDGAARARAPAAAASGRGSGSTGPRTA